MLMIPKHFYDYKRFDENYFLIHEPRMEIENEAKQVEDEFDKSTNARIFFSNYFSESFIKKSYRSNKQFKEITPLKKLLEIQESNRLKNLKDKLIKGMKYRIQCYIVDVKPEKFSESLRYNNEKNQKVVAG